MIDGYRRILLWCALASFLPWPAARAQVGPLGPDFMVNTYTVGTQDDAAVAVDADGDFIVVWASDGEEATKSIFARRFSSAGAPVATAFQVNTYTTNLQNVPAVSADPDGDFVIAWASAQDGNSFGVFARRFASDGNTIAVEFQINSYTTGLQSNMAIAHDADGDFVVAWDDNGKDGNNYGVFARRFASDGNPIAGEFQVNVYFTNIQNRPSVDTDPGGAFVIAWSSLGQDGSIGGIFARRFASDGIALATEFQVNTYTINGQLQASVAVDAEGDFVIAWNGPSPPTDIGNVLAQRFASSGAFLGDEIQLNAYTTDLQGRVQIAGEPDGDFIAVWHSTGDGSVNGIFGRRFSSAGDPVGGEFQVNTLTQNEQTIPSIAMDAEGEFVVAWQSLYPDVGIFARRFGIATVSLDIDGNHAFDPLTDGQLVLRRLFGFTGNTLTMNAVGDGCSNCTADEIQTFITELGLVLDIDGNGSLGALTDGLLALRRLFDFTGDDLIRDAVGAGCSRCTAEQIEPYLADLLD